MHKSLFFIGRIVRCDLVHQRPLRLKASTKNAQGMKRREVRDCRGAALERDRGTWRYFFPVRGRPRIYLNRRLPRRTQRVDCLLVRK
jgi:hypothetical protein